LPAYPRGASQLLRKMQKQVTPKSRTSALLSFLCKNIKALFDSYEISEPFSKHKEIYNDYIKTFERLFEHLPELKYFGFILFILTIYKSFLITT
jgi:hypothetical protein